MRVKQAIHGIREAGFAEPDALDLRGKRFACVNNPEISRLHKILEDYRLKAEAAHSRRANPELNNQDIGLLRALDHADQESQN